ncbi:MAG: lipocalin family protein [Acidovorax sp.]|uniref:lipocalin family protein n=1 Tax=Acidovorax sp. TaxID=1872122 RepID=UPI0025B99DE6|nr:lipocalin family protein [Acidovorax sp.]MCE1194320.1 lipocalin family protein [Acidovorax sp.]
MRTRSPRPLVTPWHLAAGIAVLVAVLALSACTTPRTPEGIQPVTGFDVDRYAGHWHEVARIDHHFERGLIRASATYTRNPDGQSLKVVNRGYDPVRRQWKEAEGTARFVGDPARAALKVSFFGPFYGGYNVVALDENYQWALVVGSSTDYVWILSRTPALPAHVREHLLERARELGIDMNRIVWEQEQALQPSRTSRAAQVRRAPMT